MKSLSLKNGLKFHDGFMGLALMVLSTPPQMMKENIRTQQAKVEISYYLLC